MGFSLIRSNRVERLQDALAAYLRAEPLPSPLMAETVVIPGPAMERWLALQLASSLGIHANQRLVLPAAWIWSLVTASLPAAQRIDMLSRERMSWLIFDLLPGLLADDAFLDLRHYLADDPDDCRRWQLSSRIASVFDRYQYYRPDWIRQWSSEALPSWQATLWRALVARTGEGHHRVALMDRWLQELRQGRVAALPPRVIFFGISSLPPLLIQALQALSTVIDVQMFQFTPTAHYWADLVSERERARQRLRRYEDQAGAPDDAVYHEVGHELLASWGRQGQAFQDLLLDATAPDEYEFWDESWPDTLLGRLQADIFDLNNDVQREAVPDDSLQLHVCHSPMREVQVLHDQLLAMLEQDPTLRAEDILVMIPEISRYAPYIEAVFAESPHRPFIPWNLSDITLADNDPVIEVFFQLLGLPHSRFTYSEVIGFLDVVEISRHAGLDEEQVSGLHTLLADLGVRWGIDGAHRQSFGLPDWSQHSWQAAMDRWLAGYALGDGVQIWNGIAAMPLGREQADALAAFWLFFQRLSGWRQRLQQPRSGAEWQTLLLAMLHELFGADEETQGKLHTIRLAIDDLAMRAHGIMLSPALLRHCLMQELGTLERRGRYFSGGVSLCGMRPMRSLPFRVIALLGMQDAAFPHRESPLEFDAMAKHWRPGDPGKGEEDRYLMLETLLCARQRLTISYCGRSVRDNSECQPSVLVRELLDVLDQTNRVVDGAPPLSEQITRYHSMQPFSASNYAAANSYDAYWASIARTMMQPAAVDASPPSTVVLPGLEGEELALSSLIRFACHPVRYFFQQQLGIYLEQQEAYDDDETFSPNGLQQWSIRQQMLEGELRATAPNAVRLRADGLLPYGAWGEQLLNEHQRAVQEALTIIDEFKALTPQPCAADTRCMLHDGRMLNVRAHPARYYTGKGLLHVSASRFQAKNALPIWLEHLLLCAAGVMSADECSTLLCRDGARCWQALPSAVAQVQLTDFVNAMDAGLRQPLPVFPKTSWAWASEGDDDKRFGKALQAWHDSYQQQGEQHEPYVRLYQRRRSGEQGPADPDFARWARLWFESLFLAAGVPS